MQNTAVACILCGLFIAAQGCHAFDGSMQNQTLNLPNVTHSGYLDVNKKEQAALFYAYYERQNDTLGNDAPIILWLQVSSTPPVRQ